MVTESWVRHHLAVTRFRRTFWKGRKSVPSLRMNRLYSRDLFGCCGLPWRSFRKLPGIILHKQRNKCVFPALKEPQNTSSAAVSELLHLGRSDHREGSFRYNLMKKRQQILFSYHAIYFKIYKHVKINSCSDTWCSTAHGKHICMVAPAPLCQCLLRGLGA